jgi:hypothetical protein
MKVFIVGEDQVTFAIIKRMLAYCSDQFEIILELPARGGEVKNKIKQFNVLSQTYPVILLTDLDADLCAPQLLNKLIPDKNIDFLLNIAVDEAEAWLMADREGFSEYFAIDILNLPTAVRTKQGGNKYCIEMNFSYKSSMFLTHELIKKSNNKLLIQQLTPKKGAVKGPEYNTCILPYIQNSWNIGNARLNSNSLERMIIRLKKLIDRK